MANNTVRNLFDECLAKSNAGYVSTQGNTTTADIRLGSNNLRILYSNDESSENLKAELYNHEGELVHDLSLSCSYNRAVMTEDCYFTPTFKSMSHIKNLRSNFIRALEQILSTEQISMLS
ncbi:MAG: hypothetical protein AABX19_00500 [Nanoarchaeota archaeon]